MGGPSARSLLVLVLAEYVLPGDGVVRTRTAVEALEQLDVAGTAARQALRRLARDGWLVAGDGRGRWRLGDEALRILAESKPRFGRASRPAPPWDGRWLLLRASIPEAQRELRHRLRTSLGFQGFGSLGGGWWITADTDAEGRAEAILQRLGVPHALSFTATSGAIGADPVALVSDVWDLAEAGARFDKLVAEFAGQEATTGREAFVACTRLVDSWRQALAVDPQLPAELLPADWPGHEARALFNERYGCWHPAALAWWDDR